MAVVLATIAGRAEAQSVDSKALAEQLFNQARDLVKANHWEEACPKFEASLRYDAVLGTQLNLANCYVHIGKLASAWGLYRDATELAKKAGDAKRAEFAQQQAKALEPRLPSLRITVAGAPTPNLIVERDGVAVDPGAFGAALYVDPGAHDVTAKAPGFTAFQRSLTFVEGKAESIEIPPLVEEIVTKPEPATVPAAETKLEVGKPPPPPPSRTRAYLGLGVGAAGFVAVGTGLVFGKLAMTANDAAEKACPDFKCESQADYDESQGHADDAKSKATISTTLVIGGGVAVAAGVVLYLTAPRAKTAEERNASRLLPAAHPGGAGVVWLGHF